MEQQGKLQIVLYTIPQAACDQKKMSWNDVAALVKNQMENFFHDAVVFNHVEFMTEKWFTDADAQRLLEAGSVNFPFVLVNGEVACSEKKVNISKIRRFAESKINSLTIKNNLQI
jgi:hypothetical protein